MSAPAFGGCTLILGEVGVSFMGTQAVWVLSSCGGRLSLHCVPWEHTLVSGFQGGDARGLQWGATNAGQLLLAASAPEDTAEEGP